MHLCVVAFGCAASGIAEATGFTRRLPLGLSRKFFTSEGLSMPMHLCVRCAAK